MSSSVNNVEKHAYAYCMAQYVLYRGTQGQGRCGTHHWQWPWAVVHPWEHLSSRLGCLRYSGECPRQCRGRASGTNWMALHRCNTMLCVPQAESASLEFLMGALSDTH